jgi:hypothetical protein
MGADWVRLFDKRLCDEIVALDSAALTSFVSSHLAELDQYNIFRFGFAEDVSVSNRIQHLIASGQTEQELKYDLVDSLCVFGEWLYLDYWACYVEVFGSDPPGSIPDREIFPHVKEQQFLLLRPEHVEQMIRSLDDHLSEVTVMDANSIALLRQWRDRCSIDNRTMVAYFLSY